MKVQVKLLRAKDKENVVSVAKQNQRAKYTQKPNCKHLMFGKNIKITADFLKEIMETRRQ